MSAPLVEDPEPLTETNPLNRRYYGVRLRPQIHDLFQEALEKQRLEIPSLSVSQFAEMLIQEALAERKRPQPSTKERLAMAKNIKR